MFYDFTSIMQKDASEFATFYDFTVIMQKDDCEFTVFYDFTSIMQKDAAGTYEVLWLVWSLQCDVWGC